jgi:L-lactate dehydrogenase complex protein LldG
VIDEFLRAVEAYGGVTRRVPTSGAARAAVGELLHESGARTFCQWSGDALVAALELASLAEEVQPADADAGITGAAHAVAETGTLLLTYGEGRGREVGLLPDLHVAVLSADRIVGDLQTAVALAFAGGGDPPAALTMITGLSASSDIEKVRITGVHGPRRLAVVVVG